MGGSGSAVGGIGSAGLTRHRRPPSRVHRCAEEEDFGRWRRLPEGAEELMLDRSRCLGGIVDINTSSTQSSPRWTC